MLDVILSCIEIHKLQDLIHAFELFLRDTLGRPVSGLSFEQRADGVDIGQVLIRHAAHHDAAVGQRNDEILTFELLERFTHRSAAHAQLFCDFHLDEQIAGMIPSVCNSLI